MTQCLILACSARKRPDKEPMPAYLRYDGPMWQTLRKRWSPDDRRLEVFALSAKFGLISAKAAVFDYDVRLTDRRQDTDQTVAQYLTTSRDLCLPLRHLTRHHSKITVSGPLGYRELIREVDGHMQRFGLPWQWEITYLEGSDPGIFGQRKLLSEFLKATLP